MTLSRDEAMDVIDTYGPDRDLWPQQYRNELDDLLKSDGEFADYVEDVARIERMLEDWDEGEDGINVDPEDLDDPFNNMDDEPEDEDEEDEPESGVGAGGFADQDDAEASDDENSDEQEDVPVLEVDLNDLSDAGDMDELLCEIIRKEIDSVNADATWNVFTKDYDKLLDLNVPPTTSLTEIEQATAKATGPLQKDLRRLIAARSQAKRLPGMRRGRLHAPNLHRILAGDDRVFVKREEAPSLDTAITMLIDCSGSMEGPRMKLAAETAYAVGSVLARLGISFECLGFTSHAWAGNDAHPDVAEWTSREYMNEVQAAAQLGPIHRFQPIMIPTFKTFDERWTPVVQKRLAYAYNKNGQTIGDVHMSGTPESCGNEFAARRLLQRKEARKIMITMTDGEPTMQPYGSPLYPVDPYGARKRSAEVVKKIEAAGIDLIGIGIQHAAPKAYYTNAMIINSLEEMPVQLLGLLKKLLLGK